MKILKVFITLVVVIVALLFVGSLFLPGTTLVTRSAEIRAPQALVFELVANHADSQRWSPWAAKDPSMSVSYEGPKEGVGSKQVWASTNPAVGNGSSTFTEHNAPNRVAMDLRFDQGGGIASFDLRQTEQGLTRVDWTYQQEHSFLFERWFGLIIEPMLAPDFESGLASLKALAESLPAIKTEEINYEVDGVDLTGFIAYPMGAGSAPGVLIVHEWWGHNAYVRKRAAMLAELGYTAFALDMYGDGKLARHPSDAQGFMMEVFGSPDVEEARFDAAAKIIRDHKSTDAEKLAAIGYCFGGKVALNMGLMGKDLDAVVSFHGSLGDLRKPTDENKTPLLILNGAADPFVPEEQKTAFKAMMDEYAMNYELIEYADAKHAFTVPGADEIGKQFEIPLAYNEAADEASWQKMKAFLKLNLGQ